MRGEEPREGAASESLVEERRRDHGAILRRSRNWRRQGLAQLRSRRGGTK
jgi:hypothetical protein